MRSSGEINFITSNQGKIKTLDKYLKQNEIDFKVIPHKLNIVEPQASTVEEISKSKALQAFEILKQPVLVEDGGFYIEELNNFPGVYVRYILDTIGTEGILKLMENKINRKARFVSCATYINENGELLQFTNDKLENSWGFITKERSNVICPNAWSDLWYIFSDDENSKTWAELSNENKPFGKYHGKSSIENFVLWFKENN